MKVFITILIALVMLTSCDTVDPRGVPYKVQLDRSRAIQIVVLDSMYDVGDQVPVRAHRDGYKRANRADYVGSHIATVLDRAPLASDRIATSDTLTGPEAIDALLKRIK